MIFMADLSSPSSRYCRIKVVPVPDGIQANSTSGFASTSSIRWATQRLAFLRTIVQRSAAHDWPENEAFVTAFKGANKGLRPNLMAVRAYNSMHMIIRSSCQE